MKKDTSSAKAPLKPKGNEKKASAKRKVDSHPETPAITGTEVTCQTSEQITNHAPDQLTNQSEPPVLSDVLIAGTTKPQTASNFPIDALPSRLQVIIREANATLGFPVDYMAGAILSAMAAVIGNTHHAEAMTGWKEYAILFVALVGCPGVCKSHPLSYVMQPLIDHDAEKAAQFAEALKRYNAAMELPPKERVANGYDLNPVEPYRVRFMMQDVTNEAVHRILSENRRGLILMYDELAGWVKNFNRYIRVLDVGVQPQGCHVRPQRQSERRVHPQSVPMRHRHYPAEGFDRPRRRKPQRQRLHGAFSLCRAGRPIKGEMEQREKNTLIRHRCGMA